MDYIESRDSWRNGDLLVAIAFTFLHWGGPGAARDATRWERMALRVRRGYHRLVQYSHGRPKFEIEMIAGDETVPRPMTRPFSNIDSCTAEALSTFFEQMLQSDETLELDGLRIIIRLIGADMQNPVVHGRGRPMGMHLIPAHLKKRGTSDSNSRLNDSP